MISIEKIAQGDEKEFKLFFDEQYNSLCSHANRYLNDDTQAEDIVQDSFLKYWNNRKDFDNYYKVKSFMYKVITNACLNIIRQNKKKYRENISILENEVFFKDSLIYTETLQLFYQAINSLPDRSRQLANLAVEGYKNDEIASIMNISPATVHTIKKTVYKKLRLILKDYYYLFFVFLN